MVALDVQLQSAGRGVLLRAAGVWAHVRLRLTTPYDPHVGRALVDLQVLLEVLLVVELLATVRLGAHEVARTVHLVRAHVHVQVALPVEHSTPHAPAPRALVAAGVHLYCGVLRVSSQRRPHPWEEMMASEDRG